MDDGIAIDEGLRGGSVPGSLACRAGQRWPEGIIDPIRFPAMGIAQTSAEMAAVGRLRYELFIERQAIRPRRS